MTLKHWLMPCAKLAELSQPTKWWKLIVAGTCEYFGILGKTLSINAKGLSLKGLTACYS
jgi:hypothetical protein